MTQPLAGRSLQGDEADLFRALHRRLLLDVCRHVPDLPSVAEEAVGYAWTELIAHQPRREFIAAWLRVVARREAIRLAQRARCQTNTDGLGEYPASGAATDDHVQAREALALLARLPKGQREVLGLRVAGYRYEEIASSLQLTRRQVQRRM